MSFCGIQLKTLTLEGRFLGTCSEIELIKQGDKLRSIFKILLVVGEALLLHDRAKYNTSLY